MGQTSANVEVRTTVEAQTTAEALRLTRHFAAPRAAVFRAFTDPAELAKWFGPEGVSVKNVKIDLKPGGAYSLDFNEKDGGVHGLSGVYREILPPERLVMTWTWDHGGMAGVETLVTVELAEVDGETELTLIHEGLPSDEFRDLHNQGWTSSFGCLEKLFEQGDPS